jgi:zinc-ribbon domain
MALRACSECGKDVSDKAAVCPHCGNPLAAAAPAPAPAAAPTPTPVVVQKNTHPVLTVIGGLAVVLIAIGFIANLIDNNAAPPPSAHFITTDVLSDENCTQLGDYCIQIHCTYQNTGDAPGERQVHARMVAMDSDTVLGERTSSLTLLPGATQRVTFAFPEATIDAKARVQCSVDDAE